MRALSPTETWAGSSLRTLGTVLHPGDSDFSTQPGSEAWDGFRSPLPVCDLLLMNDPEFPSSTSLGIGWRLRYQDPQPGHTPSSTPKTQTCLEPALGPRHGLWTVFPAVCLIPPFSKTYLRKLSVMGPPPVTLPLGSLITSVSGSSIARP